MSWVATAMVASSAISAGSTAYAGHQSRKASKAAGEIIGGLEYYEDPDYRETQDFLKDFGLDILGGDVPDYYSAIGETGSQEFEDMLQMSIGDVQKSTAESLAAGGRSRGGALAASTADAVSDLTTQARYDDYLRALSGKQSLLGTGLQVTEGVRQAGQLEGQNVGEFEMSKASALAGLQYQKADQAAQEVSSYADILNSAIYGVTGTEVGGSKGILSLIDKNPTTTTPTKQELSGKSNLGAITMDIDPYDYWNQRS